MKRRAALAWLLAPVLGWSQKKNPTTVRMGVKLDGLYEMGPIVISVTHIEGTFDNFLVLHGRTDDSLGIPLTDKGLKRQVEDWLSRNAIKMLPSSS